MHAVLSCPQCQRPLRVPEEVLRGQVQCPLCHFAFLARDAVVENPIADPGPPSSVRRRKRPPPPPPSPQQRLWSEPLEAQPVPDALEEAVLVPSEEVMEVVSTEPVTPAPAASRPPSVRKQPVPFAPIRFQVFVESDPEGILTGRMEAEVGPTGLRLWGGRDRLVLLPPGTTAGYDSPHSLWVELEGRRVELQVLHDRHAERLAEEVASFLTGVVDAVRLPGVGRPWYLFLPALLPLLLPSVAIPLGLAVEGFLGWLLWGGLGVILAGACVALALPSRWSVLLRTVTTSAVGLFALVLLFVGFLIEWNLTPTPIPSTAWRSFSRPDRGYRVLMPGVTTAVSPREWGDWNLNLSGIEISNGRMEFVVGDRDLAPEEVGPEHLQQHFHPAHVTEVNGHKSIILSEKDVALGDVPGREWVLQNRSQGVRVIRVFASSHRLYLVGVRGRRLDPNSPDVRKFIDSFQILPEDGPKRQ